MQGLFGAVFGISSVLGPLAGAYFTDNVDWTWIFYINLPLGVAALVLIALFYHPVLPSNPNQKIDWAGTVSFAASILSLMFGLELGGKDYAWSSSLIIGLFAVAAVLFVLFLWVETRAVSPVVPLFLFRNRIFTASMGASFFYGALLISAATYIPLFIQGVFQGSATSAGLVLTPMMLGVVFSSVVGGRFIGKTAYRNILLVSAALLLAATSLLGTVSIETERWQVTLYMVLMGLGVGMSFPVTSISSLHNVGFQFRGVVTSLVGFFRSIGSAVGVTILGSVQAGAMSRRLSELLPSSGSQAPVDPRALLSPEFQAHVPKPVLETMVIGLAESIAVVFQVTIVMAVLALLFILLMGSAKLEVQEKGSVPLKEER